MSDSIDFLLCFDENYNIQAEVTISSLLENSNKKLNFHIIHDNPTSFEKTYKKLGVYSNLQSLELYKFSKRPDVIFPNFDESHMSEATYFRLFLEDYLPRTIKNIIYIDPDVICLNNFDIIAATTFEILNNSKYVIAAKTEHYEESDNDTSNRLELTRNKYFNAGVTFIDYEKWIKEGYTEKLISKMNYLGDRAVWVDQCALNSFIDGLYIEIPEQLNFTSRLHDNEYLLVETVFYHFAGSRKPWTVKGVYSDGETLYQHIHKKLYNNNYHIVHKYKKDSIYQFFRLIVSLKILKLKNPFTYIRNFVDSF
tara:strand:+ start:1282 stop:2211 length:930 start_codon:yes stop_codon:yes gene_type:complete